MKSIRFLRFSSADLSVKKSTHARRKPAVKLSKVAPAIAIVLFAHKAAVASLNNLSDKTAANPTPNHLPGSPLVDIIGVVLFLALIAAHFCLCRNGFFPESSALCDVPEWFKKLSTRVTRNTQN